MREIKFRAWNPNGNRFESYAGGINMPLHEAGALVVKVPVLEVMQYTGLKDKNGVEIYEGDICAYNHTETSGSGTYADPSRFWDVRKNGVCNFKNGTFLIDNDVIREDVEVIGNIYENPELLKAQV